MTCTVDQLVSRLTRRAARRVEIASRAWRRAVERGRVRIRRARGAHAAADAAREVVHEEAAALDDVHRRLVARVARPLRASVAQREAHGQADLALRHGRVHAVHIRVAWIAAEVVRRQVASGAVHDLLVGDEVEAVNVHEAVPRAALEQPAIVAASNATRIAVVAPRTVPDLSRGVVDDSVVRAHGCDGGRG